MNLKKLIADINILNLAGKENVEISRINYDSRKIGPGDLFVAVKGHAQDGHDFIENAVSRGATAILSESAPRCRYSKTRPETESNAGIHSGARLPQGLISAGHNILWSPFPQHEPDRNNRDQWKDHHQLPS